MKSTDLMLDHCERAYRSANLIQKPFPHYVIDDFLPDDIFSELVNVGLAEKALIKRQFETSLESGKSVHGNEGMNSASNIPIQLLGGKFGSKLISDLFGVDGVSSMFDRPNFGGYYPFHQMSEGGFLGAHVDHSSSTDGQIHIANCIFYASPNWPELWGGDTILFDRSGLREVARVHPKPNRLLVFLHSSLAFHGVDTLHCPTNAKRMTYYMDYYATSENANKAYARYNAVSRFNRFRTWNHGTIFIPFHPLGTFRLPGFSSIKHMKGELAYAFHYAKYILARLFTRFGFAWFRE